VKRIVVYEVIYRRKVEYEDGGSGTQMTALNAAVEHAQATVPDEDWRGELRLLSWSPSAGTGVSDG